MCVKSFKRFIYMCVSICLVLAFTVGIFSVDAAVYVNKPAKVSVKSVSNLTVTGKGSIKIKFKKAKKHKKL